METQVSKQVFYKDADASFEYEEFGASVLLHCEVLRWTPSIVKKGYMVLGDFMNTMRKQGFKRLVTVTPNPKFAKLFGGKTENAFIYEGKEHEVVVWDLN